VLFTDGVCEVASPARETFGEERLQDALQRRLEQAPEAVFKEVLQEAEAFSGGLGFDDDVCLLGMEVKSLGVTGAADRGGPRLRAD
jgi:serine phosphatase RsbU (regulator of sigma subunit)